MNIRNKLILGLASLCGIFGLTGIIFYAQVQEFDQEIHELEDVVDRHLHDNVEQLSLDFEVLIALNQIRNTLNGSPTELPDPQQLTVQLAAFETQSTQLIQSLRSSSNPPVTHEQSEEYSDHEEDHHTHEEDEHSHAHENNHDHHAHEEEQETILLDPDTAAALAQDSNAIDAQTALLKAAVNRTIAAIETNDRDTFIAQKQAAEAIAQDLEANLATVTHHLQAQADSTVLQLDRSLHRFDDSIHNFIKVFGVGAFASIIVSGGVGCWLLRTISRPLEKLKQATSQVGQGQWQTITVSATQDELSQVAVGFNTMVDRLQETYGDLERQITALEASEIELLNAKQAAEDANLAKSTFLANMSHELRTPLNAIIGYSEMLQEEAEDLGEEDFVPDLAKIHSAGKHLLQLINDILDISKIEAGRMDLYLEHFDLNTMLQDVATTIAPLIEKNENTLVRDYPPDLGAMYADITKVRQNLFNLLSNACKFTQKGTVTLRVKPIRMAAGQGLQFEVSDTGIGMSPEQVGHVFELFSQADASTTRKYGGTGLGLTITRSFCQMMGGDITVSSIEGEGSTFIMTLPQQVASPSDDNAPNSPSALQPNRGNGSILVIDDDATVRDFLQRSLSRYGYEVQVATNGAEGLELAKTLQPSAIALDVMMPGMDGWAVLTALKEEPETAHIPVVMLTMINDRNLGYALGASDYLLKPVNRDQLLLTLHRFRGGDTDNSILIVDDSVMNREVLRRQIEKEGWTVEEAHHGRQALDLIKIHSPDVILLDLMMPEMDGFQFLEALSAKPEWRTIPVVVITAKDLTEADRQRLNGGVEAIYHKGTYNRQALVNEVQRLLQQVLAASTDAATLNSDLRSNHGPNFTN